MNEKIHFDNNEEKRHQCVWCGGFIETDERQHNCIQPGMEGHYHFGKLEDEKKCFQKACEKNSISGIQSAVSGRAVTSGYQNYVPPVKEANPYAFNRRN